VKIPDDDPDRTRLLLLIASLLLLVPVLLWGSWIRVVQMHPELTQAERVRFWLSIFPTVMRHPQALTVAAVGCSLGAAILSAITLQQPERIFKLMSIITMITAGAAAVLSLISLM
jgi:hypothetical protein